MGYDSPSYWAFLPPLSVGDAKDSPSILSHVGSEGGPQLQEEYHPGDGGSWGASQNLPRHTYHRPQQEEVSEWSCCIKGA